MNQIQLDEVLAQGEAEFMEHLQNEGEAIVHPQEEDHTHTFSKPSQIINDTHPHNSFDSTRMAIKTIPKATFMNNTDYYDSLPQIHSIF